ncbi:MAG TPA: DoxX family membrane protein [Candidatus Acidoferrum sp.]|nr:DoxX family membrane protein [Candidatus Acidoferrum sp.]
MNKNQQPGLCLFVAGLIGLGVIGVMVRDFALVWQPVPEWVPARHAVAVGTGALMILLGLGLAFRASRAWAVRILFPYLILWAALKVPEVAHAPGVEGSWLGLGELTLLLSGGSTLFAVFSGISESGMMRFLTGDRGMRLARILFAVSILPIGLSHIVYADVTAGFVPHYLPYRLGWAYLTGAGQIASGLGILVGVLARVAAWAEAGQITLYTFLVWGGMIAAAPKTRMAWTGFFISWIFGAAAWVVAQNVPEKISKQSASG